MLMHLTGGTGCSNSLIQLRVRLAHLVGSPRFPTQPRSPVGSALRLPPIKPYGLPFCLSRMGLIWNHHICHRTTPPLHLLPYAPSRLPLPRALNLMNPCRDSSVLCDRIWDRAALRCWLGPLHQQVCHSQLPLDSELMRHSCSGATCSVFVGTATTFPSADVSALPSSLTPASLSHIAGILVMVAAERLLSRSTTADADPPASLESGEAIPLQDDMELSDLEGTEGLPMTAPSTSPSHMPQSLRPHLRRITLFTFGLVAGEVGSGISIGYATTALSWNSDAGGLAMPPLDAVLSYFVRLMGKSRERCSSPTRGLDADRRASEYLQFRQLSRSRRRSSPPPPRSQNANDKSSPLLQRAQWPPSSPTTSQSSCRSTPPARCSSPLFSSP